MKRSISEYFYEPSGPKGHRCGYCKSEDTSISEGMWAHCLTVEDYQDLIDRGWRRSGQYCYKPLMSSTCCPLYGISCSATKFRISKSQKGCLKNVNKFLLCGKKKLLFSSVPAGVGEEEPVKVACSSADVGEVSSTSHPKQKKRVRPGEGADLSKPLCRKAKVKRLERKAKKKLSLSATALTVGGTGNSDSGGYDSSGSGIGSNSKSVKMSEGIPKKDTTPEFLKVGADGKKPLEFFLCLPDPPCTSLAVPHTLKMELIRSSPPSAEFKAVFAESYALYKKYQMTIHKDKEEKCNESSYQKFLCSSPLIPKKGQDGWPCDYGSYHQHYRIDGKLVAVGVIDILPKCLSSVYAYFDTDYSFLRLGVYTALREIEMTRKLHLCDPAKFKYYYMGYYVHSCQKMRYKGNYSPSFLLCPDSYNFMPIETCRPKIDQAKYSRLCDRETIPENVQDWLGNTQILCNNSISSFSSLLPRAKIKEEKVKAYARLVGPKVAGRMLLYLEL